MENLSVDIDGYTTDTWEEPTQVETNLATEPPSTAEIHGDTPSTALITDQSDEIEAQFHENITREHSTPIFNEARVGGLEEDESANEATT